MPRFASAILVFLLSLTADAARADVQGRLNGAAVPVHLFWGVGCAHCDEERAFLAGLGRSDPRLRIAEHEVLKDRRNLELLQDLMDRQGKETPGVPVTFVGERVFVGFSGHIRAKIMRAVEQGCVLQRPS